MSSGLLNGLTAMSRPHPLWPGRFPLARIERLLKSVFPPVDSPQDGSASDAAAFRRAILELHRLPPSGLREPERVRECLNYVGFIRVLAQEQRTTSRQPTQHSQSVELRDTQIQLVDDRTANQFYRTHHYLGGTQRRGNHLGLFASSSVMGRAEPFGVLTLSAFDLAHLERALPRSFRKDELLVLSRFATSAVAPSNAGSYFLGQLRRWVARDIPRTQLLLTYLDPNPGFHGSLYRAANWWPLVSEAKERYLYFDGRFVTDREMLAHFGTSHYERLRAFLGDRVERSWYRLYPLQVFACWMGNAPERGRRRESHASAGELVAPLAS